MKLKMREPIRKILILEPSVLIAEGLRHIIDNFAGYDVCGIIRNQEGDIWAKIDDFNADLVIADPSVFDNRDRAGAHDMIKGIANAPVMALISAAADAAYASTYDGTIYLSDTSDDIEQKISTAMKAAPAEQRGEGEELSSREKEILVCVAKGMLNKEIADHFNISIYTVITHRKNITRKTGIKTVAGLTVYALLNNLIDMNAME